MKICLVHVISRSEFLVVLGLCRKLWLGFIRSQKQSFVLSEAAHTMLLIGSTQYFLTSLWSTSKVYQNIAYPHTPHCIESGEMMSNWLTAVIVFDSFDSFGRPTDTGNEHGQPTYADDVKWMMDIGFDGV